MVHLGNILPKWRPTPHVARAVDEGQHPRRARLKMPQAAQTGCPQAVADLPLRGMPHAGQAGRPQGEAAFKLRVARRARLGMPQGGQTGRS